MSPGSTDDAAVLARSVNSGFWISRAFSVLLDRGVLDALTEASRSTDEVARRIRSTHRGAEVLLRVAQSLGLVRYSPEGWTLSERGAPFVGPERDVLAEIGHVSPRVWSDFERFEQRLSDDDLATHTFFDHLSPDETQGFTATMALQIRRAAKTLAGTLDLDRHRHLVDVGCGAATLSLALVAVNPHLSATLVDRPALVPIADAAIDAAGLRGRAKVIAADMFADELPAADLVLLVRILHDWPDAECVDLLQRCTRGTSPDTAVLVVEEMLAADDSGDSWPLRLDLFLYASLGGGRTRSVDEIGGLLAGAGLSVQHAGSLPDSFHYVMARR